MDWKNIYDQKKLKKLGMHALLGVGQGVKGFFSNNEWNGGKIILPLAL